MTLIDAELQNEKSSNLTELNPQKKRELYSYWEDPVENKKKKTFLWPSFSFPVLGAFATALSVALFAFMGVDFSIFSFSPSKPLQGSLVLKNKKSKDLESVDYERVTHFVVDLFQRNKTTLGESRIYDFQNRMAFESQKGINLSGTGGVASRAPRPLENKRDYRAENTIDLGDPIKKSILKIHVQQGPSSIMKGVRESYENFLSQRGVLLTGCLQKFIPHRSAHIKWRLNKSLLEGPIAISKMDPHPQLELCLLHALKNIPRPEIKESVWDMEYQIIF